MVEVKNVKKQQGSFVLEDISFSLPKGYIMGLIGANGAGKT
ncbi:MAG: ATP-binding cassette domain-containing protein, partial [Acetivibrio ethanolgignens]